MKFFHQRLDSLLEQLAYADGRAYALKSLSHWHDDHDPRGEGYSEVTLETEALALLTEAKIRLS